MCPFAVRLALCLAGAAICAACGDHGAAGADAGVEGGATCTPGTANVTDDTTMPQTLDAFCQVSIENAIVVPKDAAVLPYDLNTPLFSDYAVKFRTVWVPPGTSAPYAAEGTFDLPVGTVITKSFGWPADFRKPTDPVRWRETRVIVHTPKNGWTGASYEWNEAQTVATLVPGGDVLEFSFIGADGHTERPNYLVPSQAQCPKCHANEGVFTPLGPTAAQLNRTYGYAGGPANELSAWSKLGILSGAPSPSAAPALPVWDEPSTGTTDQRARAYMQANCAFCHDGNGEARTTGLVLLYGEEDPAKYGVCKAPVAAGKAAGDDQYDVVPGSPETSILIRRVTSTEPAVAMPEIGRSLEHVEGVQLLTDWITAMTGSCP
jgi:uncharacterized repeat protein (TIGR03806 family)